MNTATLGVVGASLALATAFGAGGASAAYYASAQLPLIEAQQDEWLPPLPPPPDRRNNPRRQAAPVPPSAAARPGHRVVQYRALPIRQAIVQPAALTQVRPVDSHAPEFAADR